VLGTAGLSGKRQAHQGVGRHKISSTIRSQLVTKQANPRNRIDDSGQLLWAHPQVHAVPALPAHKNLESLLVSCVLVQARGPLSLNDKHA
jgi:hypothetical protein